MARTRIDLPEAFPFRVTLPVRVTDVNYGGHLGNDAVLGLIHEARIAFLAKAGYTEHDVEGMGIIMTEAHVLYRAEAFHGEQLHIEAAIGEVSSHGFEILHRISKSETGQEVARVRTGFAFFDYEKKKVAHVPPGFLQRHGRNSP